nr:MAG TPA: hypothetical protein [Caudoviricetes sp.]DAT57465.1 MAG TPA: hypothetical protein [Caudoviricetes sp.]
MDIAHLNAIDQIELHTSLQDYLQPQWWPKDQYLSILQRTTILLTMVK